MVTTTRATNPQRFGIEVDPETVREYSRRGVQTRKDKAAAGLVDTSRLKKLSSTEFYEHYTSRAFPQPWDRFFNSQHRDYIRYYQAVSGQAPQYRTLCWRAAALSTALAMIESHVTEDASGFHKFQTELIECIAQLQRYTESEKRESVVIDATKERVLSLVIAVADHVLADETKPALFAALRRVIAGGEFDPARAISLLSQAAQTESGTVVTSTSRPAPDPERRVMPAGDRVPVLDGSTRSEPEAVPDEV